MIDLPLGVIKALLEAAASGVDAAPIIAAIIAAAGGAGGAAWFTRRATNDQLQADGERLFQDALLAAEERGAKAVATVDKIRRVLEDRLDKAEEELHETREQLREAEMKIRELELRHDGAVRDRDLALVKAQTERERLEFKVTELQRVVVDLEQRTAPGRRRHDTPERGTEPDGLSED